MSIKHGTNRYFPRGPTATPPAEMLLAHVTITFADSPYTASSTDGIIGTNSAGGPITIVLPLAAAAGAGRRYIIKDERGSAGLNPVTVTPTAPDVIDNAATFPIAVSGGSSQFYSNGSFNWFSY